MSLKVLAGVVVCSSHYVNKNLKIFYFNNSLFYGRAAFTAAPVIACVILLKMRKTALLFR